MDRDREPDLAIEILVRLGQFEAARSLLVEDTSPAFDWLRAPDQRQAPWLRVGEVLHPLRGCQDLRVIRVRPYGQEAVGLVEAVAVFHQREFPGCVLELLEPEPAIELSFETIRDMVEAEQFAIRADETAFVTAVPDHPTPYSAGLGMPGVVVLGVVDGDPFLETLAAHEFYHSVLDLTHTDGLEGPDDPGSVLGEWGRYAPLKATYVSHAQRRFCTTTSQVQALVEEGDLRGAVALDPHYVALYPRLALRAFQARQPERAIGWLEQWSTIEPSVEAAAELYEALLLLGRCAGQVARAAPGYGLASNTHLYLAQAALRAHHFERAAEQAQMALELEPGHPHGLFQLGWANHCLGRHEQAAECYRACPDWGAVRVRQAWLEGRPFTEEGDADVRWAASFTLEPEQAIAGLRGLEHQAALHRLGVLLLEQADREGARRALTRAIELHPYRPWALECERLLAGLQ
ncbi:MAG: hypothetical protein KC910_09260 [Candidatus Eremiobacteraeota bacterium]|nr:hypothetical protein [Candidatus Eremiobacteraeota bacterium]